MGPSDHHITQFGPRDDEMCGAFFDDTAASSSFKGICEQRHQRGDAVIASRICALVDCMTAHAGAVIDATVAAQTPSPTPIENAMYKRMHVTWVDAMSSINQCHKPSA